MSTTLKVLAGKGAPAVRCAVGTCKKRIPEENRDACSVQVGEAAICTTCVAAILEASKDWYGRQK